MVFVAADPSESLDPIVAELSALAADIVPHGRWSLHHHLLGTAEVLEAWHQPFAVRAAGMLHSIYSTEAFDRAVLPLDARARVRAIAGAEAEWLAYLFCVLPREDVYAAADSAVEKSLRSRFGEVVDVAPLDLAHLVVMHMANLADQVCSADGSPAPCLARLSRLAKLARRAPVPPPIFENCTAEVATENERKLIEAYGRALRAPLSPVDAEALVEPAISGAGRFVCEPSIILSLLHLRSGRNAAAGDLARQALDIASMWNTAWDKRLSHAQWGRIAAFVAAASTIDEEHGRFYGSRAMLALERSGGAPAELYALLEEVGAFSGGDEVESVTHREAGDVPELEQSPEDAIPSRFTSYLRFLSYSTEPNAMLWYPGLVHTAWHDPLRIEVGRELERRAPEIIEELVALGEDAGFHDESERIRRSGSWDVLMLLERGVPNEAAAERCPVTMRVLNTYGVIQGPAGLAYVSRLAPGSKVAPHRGPTNLRLRCHLGIDVPDDCGLRVGSTSRTWQRGRCLLFDDSFDHEAWNYGSRDRIVLIVDVWHPDLSEDEVVLLEALHGQVVRQAQQLSRYWRSNERSRKRSEDTRAAGSEDALRSPLT